ncbi:MAG: hypothetical protein KatS3mg105_1037 [Gemmatales bacterium]|nr:MAG: hypothetical protein KatS3mg105_1037 [Gemmatales bacterium]
MSAFRELPAEIDQGDNLNWGVIKSVLIVVGLFFFLSIGAFTWLFVEHNNKQKELAAARSEATRLLSPADGSN